MRSDSQSAEQSVHSATTLPHATAAIKKYYGDVRISDMKWPLWVLVAIGLGQSCGPTINSSSQDVSIQSVVVLSDPPGATIVIDGDTLPQSTSSSYHHQRQSVAGVAFPVVIRALPTAPGFCPQVLVVPYNQPVPDTVRFQMNHCPGSGQDFTRAFDDSAVQEPPARLGGPMPIYPVGLRQAEIDGIVLIQAIIDTTGKAEPSSVEAVVASNPGFVASAKATVLGSIWRPAKVSGRKVRVVITIPITYTIRRDCPPSYPRVLCSMRSPTGH